MGFRKRNGGHKVSFSILLVTCLPLVLFQDAPALPAAGKVPAWLLEEADKPQLPLPPETEAVILLEEQSIKFNQAGIMVRSGRRAVRVLRPGGVDKTRSLVRADTYDTRVRSMTGWVINPDGNSRTVTKKNAISSSLAPDTLYMDIKLIILLLPEVSMGSVIGFEWEEESKPLSLEDIFAFQGRFPVVLARYSASVPPELEPIFHWVNSTPLEPALEKTPRSTAFRIEIRDIAPLEEEPFKPNDHALAGRLMVGFNTKNARKYGGSFRSWQEMGAWYDGLCSDRRVSDNRVVRKAEELTANINDPLARIRKLAGFVQKEIRYVSIQIGIGGLQPHTAPSILVNRYGDCKDKATLLGSLLQALGIESYYIIVNTDRGVVTLESRVSLYSFNHVILAIRLPEDVPDGNFDAIIIHPRFGRLLVFDPTVTTTPLGGMPSYLQGNTALLVAGGGGELIPFPVTGPETNLLDRKGKLVLKPDGTLTGEIVETSRGSYADSLRYKLQTSNDTERRKHLETFIARTLASFTLDQYEIRSLDDDGNDLSVSYRFTAPSYAKRTGDFLTLRPRLLGTKTLDLASDGDKARRYPLDLGPPILARDEFAIELPEGYAAEDLPGPVEIGAGFAIYRSTMEADGRTLVYRREYRLIEPFLPAARFQEARKFFLAVAAEERRNILLETRVPRRP